MRATVLASGRIRMKLSFGTVNGGVEIYASNTSWYSWSRTLSNMHRVGIGLPRSNSTTYFHLNMSQLDMSQPVYYYITSDDPASSFALHVMPTATSYASVEGQPQLRLEWPGRFWASLAELYYGSLSSTSFFYKTTSSSDGDYAHLMSFPLAMLPKDKMHWVNVTVPLLSPSSSITSVDLYLVNTPYCSPQDVLGGTVGRSIGNYEGYMSGSNRIISIGIAGANADYAYSCEHFFGVVAVAKGSPTQAYVHTLANANYTTDIYNTMPNSDLSHRWPIALGVGGGIKYPTRICIGDGGTVKTVWNEVSVGVGSSVKHVKKG